LHEIEWKNNGFLFTTPNIFEIDSLYVFLLICDTFFMFVFIFGSAFQFFFVLPLYIIKKIKKITIIAIYSKKHRPEPQIMGLDIVVQE